MLQDSNLECQLCASRFIPVSVLFGEANDVLYEMLESEPQDLTSDNEGDDEAHRPIWFVARRTRTVTVHTSTDRV